MYTSTFLTLVLSAASISALPHIQKREVPRNLIPPFGITAGTNPTGTGDCDGAPGPNGAPIKIPCACPPSQDVFLPQLDANAAAGHAIKNPAAPVNFPTDNSAASQIARIQAVIVTLQNLNGPGQGCPASSTTLLAQQAAVHKRSEEGEEEHTFTKRASAADVARLAPDLGVQAGKNPTGTGDCTGVNNIKIPCSCPPPKGDFIKALQANVAAGQAVHNPPIKVSFPTDNSSASKKARIQAGIVTLQNLRGPGQGCPAASSTFSAQLAAA